MTEQEIVEKKQWAKDLSLKVWTWLMEHPYCAQKRDTPFWNELECLKCYCPLCDVSARNTALTCASTCPLRLCSTRGKNTGFYFRWCGARTTKERYRAAKAIVKRLEQWDVTGGNDA